ncbi:CAAX prenyl protease NDAI_0K00460 [Naumovozyma dairenensis CBS 421]|uniref:intramembrane prenyl-peptidase Rce1 n=1 Tax=Naumovozyma dairenensis (strain ATCC 10597 / BCRC 20456 / CBS 421 / NBRC 0211 / NRRL Y-12639) TaxID=1071378 RepID=G0WHH6_NAUDC|nr:hypothetical protein NDAI_0K00460 [Naumovozyma dairenensis CBS 421]CCD27237.1 hypothetical protein NDAI_0K00460 [Naumovozyma dairenensis CBS 421]
MLPLPALTILLYISISYVSVLYISSKNASSNYPTLDRDDPRVITRRMNGLLKLTCFNILFIPYIQTFLYKDDTLSFMQAFIQLGLIPGFFRDQHFDLPTYYLDINMGIWIILILYVGPIIDLLLYYIIRGEKKLIFSDFKNEFNNIYSLRNYIFAPITEEIFYTSMLLNCYLNLCPIEMLSMRKLLWEPSLFFGIAHVHHMYEAFKIGDQNIITILINTMIQFSYTTLFGAFTNFVFLRTGGNLWACIFVHGLCNIMGFPGGSRVTLQLTINSDSDSDNDSHDEDKEGDDNAY